MSCAEKFVFDGKVIRQYRNGFIILVNGNVELLCILSGKMIRNKIRVNLGDAVSVEVSSYDKTKGVIVHRK
jgi:translation initiation factor IF-1